MWWALVLFGCSCNEPDGAPEAHAPVPARVIATPDPAKLAHYPKCVSYADAVCEGPNLLDQGGVRAVRGILGRLAWREDRIAAQAAGQLCMVRVWLHTDDLAGPHAASDQNGEQTDVYQKRTM